jgi:hypothetical protein
MQKQVDVQEIMTRAQVLARAVRQSEAYPAVVGGIAGGIAGALMAVFIAGRIAGRVTVSREQVSPAKEKSRFDLSVREAIQLVTIVASLVKQIQAWAKERAR